MEGTGLAYKQLDRKWLQTGSGQQSKSNSWKNNKPEVLEDQDSLFRLEVQVDHIHLWDLDNPEEIT